MPLRILTRLEELWSFSIWLLLEEPSSPPAEAVTHLTASKLIVTTPLCEFAFLSFDEPDVLSAQSWQPTVLPFPA